MAISTEFSSPRLRSGTIAVNAFSVLGSGTPCNISTCHAAVGEAASADSPAAANGVTERVGRSSRCKPRISLETTNCRPRTSVATPDSTTSRRWCPSSLRAFVLASSPGICQKNCGGSIRTRDGAAQPTHGAKSLAALISRLLGAATSYMQASPTSMAST